MRIYISRYLPLCLLSCMPLACSSAPGPEAPAPPVAAPPAPAPAVPDPTLRHPDETHLADIVQLTDGGENAEAYWSFDGTQLIFQTTRPPFGCDQIMRMPADGAGEPQLVSTGKGRTTCAYFLPGDQDIIYSSTHESGPACPPSPDHSQGYVWALYDSYEIYRAKADGSGLIKLTDRKGYDAEATVCPRDGSILFTSDRDGDLELYRMDADGSNVVRLTSTPGYDGGAFFSPDCSKIVWRASRPEGEALADFQRLLGQGLVRPSKLEIFVANADGSDARQITYLDSAAFAPYFHPSGRRILFSTNYGDPRGREFDIWAVDIDGSNLERITHTPGFDGFPMFSPDGTRLAFASNRNQGKPGETNVFVARWVESPAAGPADAAASSAPATGGDRPRAGQPASPIDNPADRFVGDVRWLADDARQGRGLGTRGLADAGDWLAAQLAAIGTLGAATGAESYAQPFDVTVELTRLPETALTIDGTPVPADAFVPASFSAASGNAAGARAATVFAGYGIVAPEHGIDDYAKLRPRGKIVVVRRFTPAGGPFDDAAVQRRYSDLQYKAFVARQRGARGLIVVDLPETEAEAGAAPGAMVEDAPLPALQPTSGDAGIPVVIVTRAAGAGLVEGRHQVAMRVALAPRKERVHNIVARIPAGSPERLPGAVVVGAHYDHLGLGAEGSLELGKEVIHNGADDNASGTAALLEVARVLQRERTALRRDVYLVAFTAEETGVIGSRHFTMNPPSGLAMKDVVAMINMDMVGRMRNNQLAVLGARSAAEWAELVEPACARARIRCTLDGDGYGPSDHMPFFTAGAPVLHLFSGAHGDYHKASDDVENINAAGGARIAGLAADITRAVANRDARLSYQRATMPERQGDVRATGGSLGTVPAYGDDSGQPGVLIDGVRAGGPAEKAGLRGGDRIVGIGSTEIRNLHDLMYVLRAATPGQTTTIRVIRDGKTLERTATFGAPSRRVSR